MMSGCMAGEELKHNGEGVGLWARSRIKLFVDREISSLRDQ